jgi:peptidoglycan/xylan/chitin deacetylase (PgdA/CDA1 family)
MHSARWQPALLIRASIVLHVVALLAVIAAPGQWRWALGAVLANHALLTLVGLWPRSHWLGPNLTRLPAAAAAQNKIALSIDDGPDPAVTLKVLDILDRYAARATFFCIGEKAARYPELCREIVRRGHAVENHSQHHLHFFAFLGPARQTREIQAAQTTLATITGYAPGFFRAPAGLRNPFLDPVLARLGLRLVAWTARGFDTRTADAATVQRRLMRNLEAGAILLLHDGNCACSQSGVPVIIEVLPVLLEAAAAAGLRSVTLADALQCENA